jgi:hypothetical protein
MEHSFLLHKCKKVIVSDRQNGRGCGHCPDGCTYEFVFATLQDLRVRLELLRQLQQKMTVMKQLTRRP